MAANFKASIPSASGSQTVFAHVKKPRYSWAMPTFFALSSFKFDYPKWGTYFSLVTKNEHVLVGRVLLWLIYHYFLQILEYKINLNVLYIIGEIRFSSVSIKSI